MGVDESRENTRNLIKFKVSNQTQKHSQSWDTDLK